MCLRGVWQVLLFLGAAGACAAPFLVFLSSLGYCLLTLHRYYVHVHYYILLKKLKKTHTGSGTSRSMRANTSN